jgi:hypothetical protein
MAISEDHDPVFDNVRGQLGEHFTNYMFIVVDDDGDLFYDYTNHRVGRMLLGEAHRDMESKGTQLDIIWEDAEVDEEEE